jgi:hypothetical protein
VVYSFQGVEMSLGGQITEDDLRRYAIEIGNAPMPEPYVDPTLSAQQAILSRPMQYLDQTANDQRAILARPMNQPFMGQPIMSRDVPIVQNAYSGLIYPQRKIPAIPVPVYAPPTYNGGGDGGGGGDSGPSDSGPSDSAGGFGAGYGGGFDMGGGLTGAADNSGVSGGFDMGGGTGSESSAAAAAAAAAAADASAAAAAAAATNDATATADADDAAAAGGGGGGDSKIICTAMNHAYGFGSFRNAIWIKYSDKHLTKAHEVGYHTLFLPLVDFAFKRGDGKLNLAIRKILEWGTRHRSTDLRAELRNKKRDTVGRVIRLIFEPLCYAVGKLKGY